MKVNMRVIFEERPVRHCAVQCPKCEKWFSSYDIAKSDIREEFALTCNSFECPMCGAEFSSFGSGYDEGHVKQSDFNIQEVSEVGECYKDCMLKKVTWENE